LIPDELPSCHTPAPQTTSHRGVMRTLAALRLALWIVVACILGLTGWSALDPMLYRPPIALSGAAESMGAWMGLSWRILIVYIVARCLDELLKAIGRAVQVEYATE